MNLSHPERSVRRDAGSHLALPMCSPRSETKWVSYLEVCVKTSDV